MSEEQRKALRAQQRSLGETISMEMPTLTEVKHSAVLQERIKQNNELFKHVLFQVRRRRRARGGANTTPALQPLSRTRCSPAQRRCHFSLSCIALMVCKHSCTTRCRSKKYAFHVVRRSCFDNVFVLRHTQQHHAHILNKHAQRWSPSNSRRRKQMA
jgi:hypothetical protein